MGDHEAGGGGGHAYELEYESEEEVTIANGNGEDKGDGNNGQGNSGNSDEYQIDDEVKYEQGTSDAKAGLEESGGEEGGGGPAAVTAMETTEGIEAGDKEGYRANEPEQIKVDDKVNDTVAAVVAQAKETTIPINTKKPAGAAGAKQSSSGTHTPHDKKQAKAAVSPTKSPAAARKRKAKEEETESSANDKKTSDQEMLDGGGEAKQEEKEQQQLHQQPEEEQRPEQNHDDDHAEEGEGDTRPLQHLNSKEMMIVAELQTEGLLSDVIDSNNTATNNNNGNGTGVPAIDRWPGYCNPDYRMPEEIQVTVNSETGVGHSFPLAIQKFEGYKPYLGGYRHKQTGKTYHHAGIQFGSAKNGTTATAYSSGSANCHASGGARRKPNVALVSRDSQTHYTKTRTAQTTREFGTQMERKGLFLDCRSDRVITAGEYQTASALWTIRVRHLITIQRYWRGYRARRRVWQAREKRWQKAATARATKKEEAAKEGAKREREMQRRMNPRTVEDFEVLFNELHSWTESEAARIKADPTTTAAEKAAERVELLRKETRLLQSIDSLKARAGKIGKGARIERMLALMSAPKKWEMSDGEVTDVHTPWTRRGLELQELYQALSAPLCSVDERLDVLLHLKWTVMEFDCRLTQEIVELIDREADLLNRGRSEKSVQGLRTRILGLFLRFLDTPDFNPEATRFMRVPPKYQHVTVEATKSLTSMPVQ